MIRIYTVAIFYSAVQNTSNVFILMSFVSRSWCCISWLWGFCLVQFWCWFGVCFAFAFLNGLISCARMIVEINHFLPKPSMKEITGGHTIVGDKLILECRIRSETYVNIVWTTPTGPPDVSPIYFRFCFI